MVSLIPRLRLAAACAGALLALAASAQPVSPGHWIATWGTSPAAPYPTDAELRKKNLYFEGETLREIVHVSVGGSLVRVRLSNVFGTDEAFVGAASIAIRGLPPRPLLFGGRGYMTLPPNAEAISDPVSLDVAPGSDVTVNLYFPRPTRGAGIHYFADQKSFVVRGNQARSVDWPKAGTPVHYWAFLKAVDVAAAPSAATIVAFGDSITDGAHSTANANRRWPDDLARRLEAVAGGRDLGVLNAGIGGNRILHDSASLVAFGFSGLSRFDRDVLAQPGARYVILLEGINDIGHAGTSAPASEAVSASDLIVGLRQLIARARECGLKVFVGTLTPFEGASPGYYTPEKDRVRQQYNAWIRTSGVPDGVIDFDKATRDPAHPGRFLPAYDSGDHLHPNDAGYKAMADAIPLGWFE